MIYAFGDCELDTGVCEVRRGGRARHVEPQVFDLLQYLVRNRERLVTRDELLDSIWGHRFITPATLNSRLKAARQAIGDDGQVQQVIRTVRGRGFRFVAPVRVEEPPEPAAEPAPAAESTPAVRPAAGAVLPLAETAPAVPIAVPAAAPPVELVARAAEMERLCGLLEAARGGARQLAFVTGESGIGKSTLAQALLDRAPAGVRTARGQCLEQHGAGEPYLPVLDALGRLCRAPDGAGVLAVLEQCAPTWLAQMPGLVPAERLEAAQRRSLGATRERMLREMVEALETATRDTPLVLLLEDLHWSDPSTLDLLAWLVQRPEPARLLVLCTCRMDDAHPPLRTALSQARRSGCCTEIALRRWSLEELRDYCGRRFGARPLAAELLRLTHRCSEGNPLFVEMLLDGWIESGALVEGPAEWIAARPPDELAREIPESLRTLVEQRIDRLSADERRVLEAGSVAGAAFSTALAAAALEMGDEAVEACCAALVRRGGLLREAGAVEWPDGTLSARFAFAHQLFQGALYGRIPLARRTRLHRAVGERLEAAHAGREAEQASELALHFRLGRDAPRAVRYLRLTAERALGRSAHREAVGHLTRALDLLRRHPEVPDPLRVELELQRMLGPALVLTRGWADPQAERAYLRAREISERLDDAAQLARVLYGLAYLHEIRGDYQRAEALVRERLRLGMDPGEPGSAIESHELLSCSLFHQGQFHQALESANAALKVLDEAPEDPFAASLGDNAAVACHYWAGLALWFLGHPDRAVEPVRRALRMAADSQLIYMQAASEWHMARLRLLRGELELAAEHAERSRLVAERQGYPYPGALALALCGRVRVHRGEVEAGLGDLRRALALQHEMGADMERPYCFGVLAEALLSVGRLAEGRAAVDEALAIVSRRSRSFFWQAELHRLRGELLLRGGEAGAAETAFREALTVAELQQARSLELRAAVSLYRLLAGRGDAQKARALLSSVHGRFTEGRDTPDVREAAALLRDSA